MPPVQSELVASVGVDGRHDAAFDADRVIHDLGQRGQTVCSTGPVRHHEVRGPEGFVVDAKNNGAVHILGRCRNQHALRTALKMRLGLFAVIEIACAFQHHIHVGPVQLIQIVGRHHPHRAATEVQRVVPDDYVAAIRAVHRIVFDQVCRSLQGARRIDGDHFYVVATRACDMRQGASANATEPVDADFDGHGDPLGGWLWAPHRLPARGIKWRIHVDL